MQMEVKEDYKEQIKGKEKYVWDTSKKEDVINIDLKDGDKYCLKIDSQMLCNSLATAVQK